ncbi:2-oxo-4-hydroxy-4-carboxy-5-ureidoimidazoline decarboxylase [Actinokineospora cianjurensis]|uniref:2-oxo-4-hydroxy-4-carboxy-5-ureidoimidazoline decarboxylase n=1 Tax=Actinokineospora cianjurensis TaxID=585224 RepID=A0A421BBH1_9PSEU|nr:2-oxo-4-hydroxy-4-carboxy-5-ureidoimidazoline decarboxylase [Actinokineospora cianjurensis]RLK61698.1 2-oxo-4-hydroxy-4-carboxy-5-ureidoimidazoline decarboxylase [Actinokineospora cianjurensis]
MPSLLDLLNGAAEAAAVADLSRCCGSARWAREVVAQRPFRSLGEVEEVSAAVLATLDWAEVLPLLDQVPRVRERWPDLGRAELIYEQRVGHPFTLCAAGLGRDEVLALLRHRSGNDRAVERAAAVGELARVVAIRLRGLVLRPAGVECPQWHRRPGGDLPRGR